jgi:hypothetical protein
MPLPIRPYPLQDESFAGYLLRIAYLNGWQSINGLASVIGLRPRKTWSRLSELDLSDIASTLAPWLLRSASMLIQRFTPQISNPLVFDPSRYIYDFRVDTPRVCIHCMREEAALKFEWSLLLVQHCAKHQCELSQCCPSCHKPFDVESRLLEGIRPVITPCQASSTGFQL